MAYNKLVEDALESLGTAALPAITKWIKSERADVELKPHLLKAALKKAVEKGTIAQVKASYMLQKQVQGAAAPTPGLARCPYKIEYAKSNRSRCRASRKTIDTGALRLAPPMYKTGNDGDERADWYSLDALFEMFRDHPKDFWLSSHEMIAGFNQLKPADQETVKGHIDSLVAERTAAGVAPVYSPYTKPCWERRALMALMFGDKAAFKAALQEEGADLSTKVANPYLGGCQVQGDAKYRESDVQIHHISDFGDGAFDNSAEACGLFYTGNSSIIWGASAFQGDRFVAFGDEMLVGYKVGSKDLEHSVGDSIVDLARKNGREKMLEGIDVLKPLLGTQAATASTSGV